MQKRYRGFTIIEVSLFLGITALIFVGIVIGTGNSLNQQRYNDSVQSFAELLRSAYSGTTNTQGNGGGRSTTTAVYGKLISFGETYDLNGNAFPSTTEVRRNIFVYDVIGDIGGNLNGGDVLSSLRSLHATVALDSNSDGKLEFAGYPEQYSMKWGTFLEDQSKNTISGAILIVRSPMSGTVYTYVLKNALLDINFKVLKNNSSDVLTYYLNTANATSFESGQIDFCVRMEGLAVYNGYRQNVRIVEGARNSSSVLIMPLNDRTNNVCIQ